MQNHNIQPNNSSHMCEKNVFTIAENVMAPPRPRRNKPRNYVPGLAARRAMKMMLHTILYTISNRAQRDEKILLYHN